MTKTTKKPFPQIWPQRNKEHWVQREYKTYRVIKEWVTKDGWTHQVLEPSHRE